MKLHGYFEKGAWIPGPIDVINETRATMVKKLTSPMQDIIKAMKELGDIEISGQFVQGRWEPITIKDVAIYLKEHPEHLTTRKEERWQMKTSG